MRLRSVALSLVVATLAAPAALAQEDCNAPFGVSLAMADTLKEAYAAMTAKDAAAQAKVLPKLKTLMDSQPAVEIKPLLCPGKNINAFTQMHYVELSAMRAHGLDGGFPLNLPLVKQPALNQEHLPYVTGWIQYEQKDFAGALATFEKGLKIVPHNTEIQNEYLATLMQMGRHAELVVAANRFLDTTYTMSDLDRSKMYQALAIAQFSTGDKASAKVSVQAAVFYDNNDDVRALKEQIDAASN